MGYATDMTRKPKLLSLENIRDISILKVELEQYSRGGQYDFGLALGLRLGLILVLFVYLLRSPIGVLPEDLNTIVKGRRLW